MNKVSLVVGGIIAIVLLILTSMSSVTVPPGMRGVEIRTMANGTNLNKVYGEGRHWGIKWMWNDLVTYDVREVTLVKRFEFNDKDDMLTGMEVSLDYKLTEGEVHYLHSKIADVLTKIEKTLKSASKEVVPQYSAVELNKTKRVEAEKKLAEIVKDELNEFHVTYVRLQITDVDIPSEVAKIAEDIAVQLQRNLLASKKEEEANELAKARIATAKGKLEAAKFDAERNDILSSPKMLELQRVENERLMWEAYKATKVSPFGNNNVFGDNPMMLLRE